MYTSVHGNRICEEAELVRTIETRWDTWKQMYPDSKVLSSETGFSRQYGRYPYGDYKFSNQLLFPVVNSDDRLHRKERVHGMLSPDGTRVFQIDAFPDAIQVRNDSFQNRDLITIGSMDRNIAVTYERRLTDGTILQFEPVQNRLPVIMKDESGMFWDVFGFAVEGQHEGKQLTLIESYPTYWFAWAAFFPDAVIEPVGP
jgi:hypothetical protein